MPDSLRFILNDEPFTRRVQSFIQTQPRVADQYVFETAADVLADIQREWPPDTGVSRAAWRGPVRAGRLAYRLTNPLPYAAVIEYGGYPGVGPKTEERPGESLAGGIEINAGIFPTQKPSAPVRRALSKHRNAITDRIQRFHQQQWGR